VGARGKQVARAEKMLQHLGFSPAKVDREFTAKTGAAVKGFQEATGLPATGHLDDRTYAKLKSVYARAKNNPETLREGMKSGRIGAVEQRLKRLGYDTGKADGVFDDQTGKAVAAFKRDQPEIKGDSEVLGRNGQRALRREAKAFAHDPFHARKSVKTNQQRDHLRGLDARVTTAAAREHDDGTRGFGVGSRGKSVEYVQQHLRAAGFDPKRQDGVFDERTAGALKQYQRRADLPVTGRVDSTTWRGLRNATMEAKSATSPHQTLNERSTEVKRTERMLREAGHNPGKVDGRYTEQTERAVDAFRRKHDMNSGDGVGPTTLRALKKATAFNPGSWRRGPGHLYGGDFSGYQSTSLFNSVVRKSKWAAIKATEGRTWTDDVFKSRWDTLGDRIKQGKMKLRIAYHFMLPGNGVEQAKHFLKKTGIHGKLQPGTRLALDWEASALSDPKALRDAAKHIHKVTGVWPLVYASHSTLPAARAAVPKAMIWDAKWGGSVPKNVPFVQTSDGPGYDHNVFNGNLRALERFAGWRR
jgi:peptidoglycan hydrolase-like protein with peptidoglycan-binding domain